MEKEMETVESLKQRLAEVLSTDCTFGSILKEFDLQIVPKTDRPSSIYLPMKMLLDLYASARGDTGLDAEDKTAMIKIAQGYGYGIDMTDAEGA